MTASPDIGAIVTELVGPVNRVIQPYLMMKNSHPQGMAVTMFLSGRFVRLLGRNREVRQVRPYPQEFSLDIRENAERRPLELIDDWLTQGIEARPRNKIRDGRFDPAAPSDKLVPAVFDVPAPYRLVDLPPRAGFPAGPRGLVHVSDIACGSAHGEDRPCQLCPSPQREIRRFSLRLLAG